MKEFSDEDRRRLATGWDPGVCTAREYASTVGVSERALRGWRARYQGEQEKSVPLGAALDEFQAFEARLAALETAVDDLRAVVARCKATVDAGPPCRPPSPSSSGAAVDASNTRHQAAGGMPAMEPAEHQAPATGVEHDEQVAVESIVHNPTVEQARLEPPRRRRRSFFDFLEDPARAADADAAPALDARAPDVQVAVASTEHEAATCDEGEEYGDCLRRTPPSPPAASALSMSQGKTEP